MVSLRDVAEKAGVAVSTASIILSRGRTVGQYSVATQALVRRVARELKYRPHPIARSLRTRETRTVGVLAPTILNEHLGPMIRGLEEKLEERGYNILVCSSARTSRKEAYWLEYYTRHVDGIVVAGDGEPGEIRLVRKFAAKNLRPIALIGFRTSIPGAASVMWDDFAGAREAVEHLIALGHKRIAYVGGRSNAPANLGRRDGYVAALESAGIAPDARLIREHAGGPVRTGLWKYGREQGRALLAESPDATAVFAFNDVIATGIIRAATEAGRRTPQELSVIGFDNLYWTEFCSPALTTVQLPREEIGRAAGSALLGLLARAGGKASGSAAPGEILIRPRLIIRESTAPPAHH